MANIKRTFTNLFKFGFGLFLAEMVAVLATYLFRPTPTDAFLSLAGRFIFVVILFSIVKNTKSNIVKYIIYGIFTISFLGTLGSTFNAFNLIINIGVVFNEIAVLNFLPLANILGAISMICMGVSSIVIIINGILSGKKR